MKINCALYQAQTSREEIKIYNTLLHLHPAEGEFQRQHKTTRSKVAGLKIKVISLNCRFIIEPSDVFSGEGPLQQLTADLRPFLCIILHNGPLGTVTDLLAAPPTPSPHLSPWRTPPALPPTVGGSGARFSRTQWLFSSRETGRQRLG